MGKGACHASVAGAITACAGGCGFAVTGVTSTHCCRRCQRKAGGHGGGCMKRELGNTEATPTSASEAPAAAPASPAVQACASGCGFAVTGVTADHCCRACQGKAGAHGRRCMKQELETTKVTPTAEELAEKSAAKEKKAAEKAAKKAKKAAA
eukprot:Hpha_TRINITY_DN15746_c2_g4::TRINITY_DN15746_c2_g4_i1::g.39863::m.39863